MTAKCVFHSRLPTDSLAIISDPTIKYVNGMPGTGKTWTFDHKIAIPHVRHKHNSVLVYAAPTNKLLDERVKSLYKLGLKRKHIVRIDSRDSDRNVVEDFKLVTTGSLGQKREDDGHIVLCTHECIARLPIGYPGKERCVLVYDEARSCLQESYTLSITGKMFRFLTERVGDNPTNLIFGIPVYNDLKGHVYVWKWANYSLPLPTVSDLAEYFPKGTKNAKLERIIAFLDNIRNTAMDVFVQIISSRNDEYIINNVMNPSRMFQGFGKVLILSALFRSSQMYEFLLAGSRLNLNEPAAVEDITLKYVDPERLAGLKKRMEHVYLTYTLETRKSMTKGQMTNAVVVQGNTDWVKKAWTEAYAGHRAESYRKVYDMWERKQADFGRAVNETRRKQPLSILSRLGNQLLGGLVPYMVRTSVALHNAFLQAHGYPPAKLPVGLNAKLGSSSTWSKEHVKQRFRGSVVKLPITAHGLNKYKYYKTCAFLAAMRYANNAASFLNGFLKDYDPEVDRTVNYALQMLWRCNVRMVNNNKVLLIVTDSVLAEALRTKVQEYYGKGSLKILPPEELIPDFGEPYLLYYARTNKEGMRKWEITNNGKVHKALTRIWRASPQGREYANLTNQIGYATKTGKDTIALKRERAKCMSLSQWKKTEEGIRAYKALIKSKFNPTAAARKALSKINGDTLARDDRLKVLSILKRTNPELKELARAWYPGDKFDSNWRSAEKYGTTLTLGWLFRLAKD